MADLLGQEPDDSLVVVVFLRLVAFWASEDAFCCFFEGKALASGRLATIEVMVLFIVEPSLELLEDPSLLVRQEAVDLVWPKSPVKDEPSSIFVTVSP